ncbi:methyltransferase domain-containing protein [Pseudoduganella sp. FT26W]|uniref:Methyltransferase domain-containing protein n=1 Tax=Duganella aquatilis TaxID=2666082 RepID=A0A844DCM5_9BURK|nr:class I SAM-dependent methyltransferase [Duganella aquatilis]MRW88235.1 methyltransferase domain-containing protein [Duganella aquatilis]
MLIQCGAMPLTLAIIYVMASFRFPVDYLTVAAVQGLLAALLTWKLALAAWWRPIQLLFPLAVLAALALQLPSWLFGLVFLLLLGWYWSTFRTQVPYYPSQPVVWDAVRQLLPTDGAPRVIDIGSGLGGLTLYLARVRPDGDAVGIELAPLPWLVSWLRAQAGRSRARFLLGDYENLDFSQFDLVFAYLSPAAMPALWRKARAEMCPGAMLVSYEFVIEERTPDSIIHATEGGVPLYIWYF